ncbi:hypothetical protein PHLCEN_2v11828 [Hermanssonia centrifuga]|uniref:F-box domain-containing protein n=1 Tax=Hermanssonia centrifuga TaxID=98765 RepID=A0A2R6NIN0_9APHY|nr:hypothetical protein PHLCEN_2v11828 [Hermanssonia centrifuga]
MSLPWTSLTSNGDVDEFFAITPRTTQSPSRSSVVASEEPAIPDPLPEELLSDAPITSQPFSRPSAVAPKVSATIDSLPAELLLDIFHHLATHHYSDWSLQHHAEPTYSRAALTPVYSWVRVTAVCKRWRAIALQCSALWSHIIPIATPSTLRLLSLSKEAPLSVAYFDPRAHPSQGGSRHAVTAASSALGHTLQHIARIQRLELHFRRFEVRDLSLLFSTATAAPMLSSLFLTTPHISNITLLCKDWVMPHLERLEIRGELTASVQPLLRPSLKHLVLCSAHTASGGASGNLNALQENLQFLQDLSHLSRLHKLHIDLSDYTGTVPSGITFPPSLRDLDVIGHTVHCADILSAFVLSDRCRISLDGTKNFRRREFSYRSLGSTDIALVLANIAAQPVDAWPLSHQTLLAVCLCIGNGGNAFELHGWTSEQSLFIFESSSTKPDVSIKLLCRESEQHLAKLLSPFPLKEAQLLKLGPLDLLGGLGHPTSIAHWFDIFNVLQHVHTLCVFDIDIWLLLAILLPQHQEPSNTAYVRFPRLTTLILVDIKFRLGNSSPRDRQSAYDYQEGGLDGSLVFTEIEGVPQEFRRCLMARASAGARVNHLLIQRASNLCGMDVASFYDGVNHIGWDRSEQVYVPRERISIYCLTLPQNSTLSIHSVDSRGHRIKPLPYLRRINT